MYDGGDIMESYVDKLYDTNLDIMKLDYNMRFHDLSEKEIISELKHIVTENFSNDFRKYNSIMEMLNSNIDVEDKMDSVMMIQENTCDNILDDIIEGNENSYDMDINQYLYIGSEIDKVYETYYTIQNIIYESYKDLYIAEENYIDWVLDDIVMEAEDKVKATGVVKGAAKAGVNVAKGATRVWEALLGFLRNIREMFMSKHKKITERDAGWLKENANNILTLKTDGVEINVHSDFKRSLVQSKTHYTNFKNAINTNIDRFKNYDEFKSYMKKFFPAEGKLKDGLLNLYRTGNVNQSYTIITLTGNAVKTALAPLLDFCNDFIESYNDINKELKESEAFIKNLQRQVKARKITTEGYCYIEESYYSNTDLGLAYDFDIVTEDDAAKPDDSGDNKPKEAPKPESNEKKKVEVKERNEMKETTDKMSDSKLSLYNKICSDRNMGISTYMTAMEKKYFDSIKILRGLMGSSAGKEQANEEAK